MGAYGWKAVLGLIVPPRTNETLLYEMMQLLPEGVSWCLSTLGLREHDLQEYARALEMVELCAEELAARGVHAMAFAGIPLSTAQGPTYHLQLVERMQRVAARPMPVTTDIAACTAAMQELGMRRITLITAYQQAMIDRLRDALAVAGFEVVCAKGKHLSLAEQITQTTPTMVFQMAIEAFSEQTNTDGFLIACPQWPVVRNIARIEAATGHPVVTQLQAIVWWALSMLGVHEPVSGYGRLLSTLSAPQIGSHRG